MRSLLSRPAFFRRSCGSQRTAGSRRGWRSSMAGKRKAPARPRTPTRPTPKPKETKPKPHLEKASMADVKIAPTKGRRGKGGGPGGHSWVIMDGGKRAGVIYINFIDEPPVGKHASIQIFLNQKSQGRGVGRVAYRMTSEASQY